MEIKERSKVARKFWARVCENGIKACVFACVCTMWEIYGRTKRWNERARKSELETNKQKDAPRSQLRSRHVNTKTKRGPQCVKSSRGKNESNTTVRYKKALRGSVDTRKATLYTVEIHCSSFNPFESSDATTRDRWGLASREACI